MALSEFANKWPSELVRAGEAISNDIGRAAFVLLLEEERKLSFRELAVELEVKQDLLSYHLGKLQSSGLVENVLERRSDTRDRSFYSVSDFGKRFADKQLEIVEHLWVPVYVTKPVKGWTVFATSRETPSKGTASETAARAFETAVRAYGETLGHWSETTATNLTSSSGVPWTPADVPLPGARPRAAGQVVGA